MNREQFSTFFAKLENCIWTLDNTVKGITGSSMARIKRNKKYNNSASGVCFILGTGPSLKLESRLDELSNYPVFTVNQFYRSELFNVVKPDYHVMIDPLFFNLDPNKPEDADTLNRIINVVECKKVKMIFPIDVVEYLEKNIGQTDDCIFVKGRYMLHDGYNREIRIDNYIPANRNVVLTAIEIAIAIGYKTIVILGCDMTGLLDNYVKRSPSRNIESFSHVYEYTEAEKKRMQKVHAMYSNEYMLKGFYLMFREYRILYEYCKKRNIVLLNASQETALDMLPFVSLDDVLDELEGVK